MSQKLLVQQQKKLRLFLQRLITGRFHNQGNCSTRLTFVSAHSSTKCIVRCSTNTLFLNQKAPLLSHENLLLFLWKVLIIQVSLELLSLDPNGLCLLDTEYKILQERVFCFIMHFLLVYLKKKKNKQLKSHTLP